MHRDRPVRVGFPHRHMMFAVTAASIPTLTRTTAGAAAGRTGLALILTRGSPFGRDEEAPSASSRQSRHARELTNGGRVPSRGR